MSLFQLAQIKHIPHQKVLNTVSLVVNLGYIGLTQIVRQQNVSRNLVTAVLLPYQNQAGGDDRRLCATTLAAYLKRSVALSVLLSVNNYQDMHLVTDSESARHAGGSSRRVDNSRIPLEVVCEHRFSECWC
jgi:hypothetical protein